MMLRFERGLRPRNPPWGEIRKGGEAPLRVSSPLVHRRRRLIIAAHDAPVAVRLSSHDHDVDVLAAEDRNHLVRPRLELGRPRLLAEGRPRIDVVLYELVVPV